MTVPASLAVPESVTFEEAIALTQAMLAQIEAGSLAIDQVQLIITDLVKSQNGARGFFVTYLTYEGSIADSPGTGTIAALRSSPDRVAELLVKNVAMSAAMVVYHRRRQDETMAASSVRVRDRSVNLLRLLALPMTRHLALGLRLSAQTGTGEYQSFLDRWGYDAEQKLAIEQALLPLLG